ncbi:TerB family tellurite resistance protein [Galbibacter sp. EGI 63066]|uniref:TerB family tellurite resistance protein n=1 Tax=Galbibacter sp. EGI 63066 TaxID=2993559 RepID=UPI002249547A|nr:TerB family tellurite resistance protein [Galbibacter sp. EGI 63066]MCX2680990.1 TerB family tellurite resistance protein [Galbibacter sp. EGI 63066]
MKRFVLSTIIALTCLCHQPARAQAQELEQLMLNIKKLDQLRKILQNMYDGYRILADGYTRVKDIAEGDFNLHDVFLDGLLAVNPDVKNYRKAAGTIRLQREILSRYQSAYRRFTASGHFSAAELQYLQKVYADLFDLGLRNLDELVSVVTAGPLRMNDAQRLEAIDRIHGETLQMLTFLQGFNGRTATVALERERGQGYLEEASQLYKTP